MKRLAEKHRGFLKNYYYNYKCIDIDTDGLRLHTTKTLRLK